MQECGQQNGKIYRACKPRRWNDLISKCSILVSQSLSLNLSPKLISREFQISMDKESRRVSKSKIAPRHALPLRSVQLSIGKNTVECLGSAAGPACEVVHNLRASAVACCFNLELKCFLTIASGVILTMLA